MAAPLPPPAPRSSSPVVAVPPTLVAPLLPPPRPAPPAVTVVGPPPGWYLDPWRVAPTRWWDGWTWTGHVSPGSTAAAVEPELPPFPLRMGVIVLAVLAVTLLAQRVAVGLLQRHHVPLLLVIGLSVGLAYGPALATALVLARRQCPDAPSVWPALAFRFRKVDVGWGLVTWLAILFGNRFLITLFRAVHVPMSSNVRVGDRTPARNLLIASTLVAVVAAPFVEEIVFRGIVLRAFRSVMPTKLAIVAQGLLFGLAHVQVVFGAGNIGLVLVLSWAGVALGTVAHHYRRLGPSICAHASINAVVFLVIWLARVVTPG